MVVNGIFRVSFSNTARRSLPCARTRACAMGSVGEWWEGYAPMRSATFFKFAFN